MLASCLIAAFLLITTVLCAGTLPLGFGLLPISVSLRPCPCLELLFCTNAGVPWQQSHSINCISLIDIGPLWVQSMDLSYNNLTGDCLAMLLLSECVIMQIGFNNFTGPIIAPIAPNPALQVKQL